MYSAESRLLESLRWHQIHKGLSQDIHSFLTKQWYSPKLILNYLLNHITHIKVIVRVLLFMSHLIPFIFILRASADIDLSPPPILKPSAIKKSELMAHAVWFHFSSILNVSRLPSQCGWVCQWPYVHMLLSVWWHSTSRMVVCLLGIVLPEYFMA